MDNFNNIQSSTFPKVQDSSFRFPISDCLSAEEKTKQTKQSNTRQNTLNKQNKHNRDKQPQHAHIQQIRNKHKQTKTNKHFWPLGNSEGSRSFRISRFLRSGPFAYVRHKSKLKGKYKEGSLIFVARWFFAVGF